jgi:hypothetical protein
MELSEARHAARCRGKSLEASELAVWSGVFLTPSMTCSVTSNMFLKLRGQRSDKIREITSSSHHHMGAVPGTSHIGLG